MPKDILKRYLIVGGISYLVEMGALYGLHHGLGFSAVKSVAFSFWVGLIVAFILQKLVAFQNYEHSAKTLTQQIGGYGILVAWNYAFSLIATDIFAKHASVFIIRTISILIITSWNYIIYKALFKQS